MAPGGSEMIPTLTYRLRRLNRSLRARLSLLRPDSDRLLNAAQPVLKIEYRGRIDSKALIVFLPGIGDLAEDFERQGFIHELQRHHVAADAVAIDAHFGYYAKRILFERITEDVLASATEAGYHEIWLVGVSLGGFGAACYAAQHHERVSGLVLLAPYLGEKSLALEIAAAGGVAHWNGEPAASHDFVRGLWQWLKRHVSHGEPQPPIYLGYGTGDKFAQANGLLAAALPPAQVFAIAGGHDWRTWRKLWRLFLEQEAIGRRRHE